MKLLFTFAIITVVLSVVYGATDPWIVYKTKYGKVYSATEDVQRKKNFLDTDAFITKQNSQTKATYQLGHNQFSDWTPSELIALQGVVKPANVTRSLEVMAPLAIMESQQRTLSADYRTHACLSPVRDQGRCGSSWAFAAITPLEFTWCIKNGSLLALSEQHLVDCEPYHNGCNGGWVTNAWNYLKYGSGGSAKQSLYPYTATTATCRFCSSMIGAKILTYGNLQPLNATHIQVAVLAIGPVPVAIAVTYTFYFYAGGIYNDVNCDNPTIGVNHAVVIVGFGTDNGIDYWIVRNSWGTGWGQAGYIQMPRGVNKCKIEQYPAVLRV